MKLFYYIDEDGNFGDDLNPWLWEKLLPEELDENENSIFVGIGTLLNQKIPTRPQKIVFGSGVGYGELPVINSKWNIYCVRGPLSAKKLSINDDLAICDAAILVRCLGLKAPKKKYAFSFIPHYSSALNGDWQRICHLSDIHYIDPSAKKGVEQVIAEIQSSEVVFAEAMHGAILADALRTPWVAVKCYDYINSFKWKDWTLTIDVPYCPATLPAIWEADRNNAGLVVVKNKLKRKLLRLGLWKKQWDLPPPPNSSDTVIDLAVSELDQLKSKGVVQLSSDRRIELLTSRLWDKLEDFKSDVRAGHFE